MCIILTCEREVRPSYDLIENCFIGNPDGAGIMWCEDGMVQLAKGFADPSSLFDAICAVPDESRLVIHMRIATSGGIDVGTCHPFPICDRLEALHAANVECDAAVAHNGIIHGVPTDDEHGVSDTVWFVSNVINELYRGRNRVTRGMRRRVTDLAPGNRFAIMTGDGEVHRIGEGWETVSPGIQASNSTWRFGMGRWDYPDDDWFGAEPDEDELDPEYLGAFRCCCGECENLRCCVAYGAECEGVEDFVMDVVKYGLQELYDEPGAILVA